MSQREELITRVKGCIHRLVLDTNKTAGDSEHRELVGLLFEVSEALGSAVDLSKIRYMFVRDPETPRVVTVGWVRVLEESASGTKQHVLYMAFAVNRVKRASVAYARDHYRPKWTVFDSFDKEVGRDKVRLRLLSEPRAHRAVVAEGENTLQTLARYVEVRPNLPTVIVNALRRGL